MTIGKEGIGARVEALTLVAFACPSCGWTGEFDNRFTQWCESCGLNADALPEKPQKRWAARRAARARARSERLCEQLATVEDLRPASAVGRAVTVVSTLVHLATAAVVAGSILAIDIWSGKYWWGWVLGAVGFLVAIVVRPQPWKALRKPRGMEERCLTSAEAPALFGLLEQCARQLQAPVPDYVLLDGRFNAATGNVGLRRRKLLILGVPLWVVLTGPERVALLGHELGHQVNRDVTHGLWATSARRSLAEWMRLFNPAETGRERFARRRLARTGVIQSLSALLMPVVLVVVFGPAFLLALGCHAALTRLDLHCGQRAEHLADELGAQLGSSAAAVSLTERLALTESVAVFLQRLKSARSTQDPWAALREYVDSIPDHEKRRRLLLDERRGTRADATHPANYLRRRLLTARPQLPGTVEVDDAEWAAIEEELRTHYAVAARNVVGTPLRAGRPVATAGAPRR